MLHTKCPENQQMIKALEDRIKNLQIEAKQVNSEKGNESDILTQEQVVDELKEFKRFIVEQDDYKLVKMLWASNNTNVYQGVCKFNG